MSGARDLCRCAFVICKVQRPPAQLAGFARLAHGGGAAAAVFVAQNTATPRRPASARGPWQNRACLPPRVQTALANTSITEPRALAEEADRFFLATQQPGAEVLAARISAPSPVRRAWGEQAAAVPSRRGDTGECFLWYHHQVPMQWRPVHRGARGAAPPLPILKKKYIYIYLKKYIYFYFYF